MSSEDKHTIYFAIKRGMDVAGSLLFFVFGWWILLLVALAIVLEDGWPPIYTHARIGKDRQQFRFYKFRSMVKNADEILFSNPELYRQIRSGAHKLKNDFRITRVGRLIRKYSLDELPQFYNVLLSQMSLVGPRAFRPDELSGYEKNYPEEKANLDAIFKVKPGITGYWQVSGRSKVDFHQRIKMSSGYARKRSLLLDLWIILKTPLAVIQAKGAE